MSSRDRLLGGSLLRLLTTGMYDDPLAIYREYVQNSADAIGGSGRAVDGRIRIDLDPANLVVRIRDNGPGLSHQGAIRALLPLGRSRKRLGVSRGFRGVGRLAGLAFGESVAFLTRERGDRPISRVVWDGSMLAKHSLGRVRTERIVRECVTIERLPGEGYPPHFFEVEIRKIGRHAAGLLLNRNAVEAYLGETAPVPLSPCFPFGSLVEGLFREPDAPLALDIRIGAEGQPITRPYSEGIAFSADREDPFSGFEEFSVPSVDGRDAAAIGWIAESGYLGAIPKGIRIRGLRARFGNMQIGGEAIFDHLFPEERFNRWCVGEVHILDPRIVPNCRRDYFEPGPHLRNLENQVSSIARRVAMECRNASASRNKERRLRSLVQELEETYDLAISGYLEPEGRGSLVREALERVRAVREGENHLGRECAKELARLEGKLRRVKGRSKPRGFQGFTAREVGIYREVFQALVELAPNPGAAKEVIEAVVERAGRP